MEFNKSITIWDFELLLKSDDGLSYIDWFKKFDSLIKKRMFAGQFGDAAKYSGESIEKTILRYAYRIWIGSDYKVDYFYLYSSDYNIVGADYVSCYEFDIRTGEMIKYPHHTGDWIPNGSLFIDKSLLRNLKLKSIGI